MIAANVILEFQVQDEVYLKNDPDNEMLIVTAWEVYDKACTSIQYRVSHPEKGDRYFPDFMLSKEKQYVNV